MGENREEESEVKDGDNYKEVIVMDTPDKGKAQITTPTSQFEDSPVFNFLNSLSPIELVKSTHITQNLNALNFASVPSVFTSPHVNPSKESRFLRRQQALDPSKPEFSTDNGNKNITDGEISNFYRSSDQEGTIDQPSSLMQVMVVKSEERPKLAVQLVRSLNYESSSPITSTISVPEFAANSKDLIPFSGLPSGEGLCGDESCMEENSQINQSGDDAEGDWTVVSDVADLLIFDSPMDSDKSRIPPDDAVGNDIASDMQNMLRMRSIENVEGNETDHFSSRHGDGSNLKDFAEVQNGIAGSSVDNGFPDQEFGQTVNCEPVSDLFHGTRRRCLVYELAGTRRKYLDQSTNSVSPAGDAPSKDKHLVPKSNMNNSRGILSGIGLHLNALATATKEYKGVKQDASVSGRLVIRPGLAANFCTLGATQEPSNHGLAAMSTEREMHPFENGVLLLEQASHESTQNVKEGQSQTSPRKKRRRLELAGESEPACKRCNCKRSKCLKLYCECFAAGVYCVEPCSCQECFNKPIHDTIVLEARKQIESRNPLAFAPKVIRTSESPTEAGDDSSMTPASARHKRGCNCKKSGCLKKYCECYQGGVGCSFNCRCEGCKNAFGRKDGSAFIAPRIELEDDEIDLLEKHIKDGKSLKTTIQSDGNQTPESSTPATPSHFMRPLGHHPLSSNKKPPRSSGPYMENSALYASQERLGKPNIPPPPKFDKHFEAASEEEMPESFQGNGSPLAGIKSSSPNRKRVSPPHCDIGMSPGRRSGRKLILKSIPAFPSLPTED